MAFKHLPHVDISFGHALEAKNGDQPEETASDKRGQRHAANTNEKGDEGCKLNKVALPAKDKNAPVQRTMNGNGSHSMAPEKEKRRLTMVGAKAIMVMMKTTPNSTFTMPLSSSPLVNQ